MKGNKQRHNHNKQSGWSSKSIKICFIAPTAYSLLSGSNSTDVIGPAIYQVLLATEIVKHSFEGTFITYDEGGPPVEYINGMKIIKIYPEGAHLNLALKAFRVWEAMKKAEADIYFHHGGPSGVAPLFCRLNKKRFVLSISSDTHVSKEIKDFGLVDRLGSRLDIKLADVVIVQSESQRMMLKENFGRDSLLIKDLCPLTKGGKPEKAKPAIVLWVGSMAEVKQPELFLKLAQAIPEGTFQMIGGYSPASNQRLNTYNKINEASERIPNFEALGFIPFGEINEYFSRAAILVNTSKFEGFPRAFIQAWMNYAPVVSLSSDPDEIICRHKLGFHSKTFSQLVKDVKILLNDEQLREDMGRNGRRYVEEEHDTTKIVDKYIEMFNRLSPIV